MLSSSPYSLWNPPHNLAKSAWERLVQWEGGLIRPVRPVPAAAPLCYVSITFSDFALWQERFFAIIGASRRTLFSSFFKVIFGSQMYSKLHFAC